MPESFEREKVSPEEIEHVKNFEEDETSKRVDYSGASGKTSEAEIALVRKLDRRIMPTLLCMYFL